MVHTGRAQDARARADALADYGAMRPVANTVDARVACAFANYRRVVGAGRLDRPARAARGRHVQSRTGPTRLDASGGRRRVVGITEDDVAVAAGKHGSGYSQGARGQHAQPTSGRGEDRPTRRRCGGSRDIMPVRGSYQVGIPRRVALIRGRHGSTPFLVSIANDCGDHSYLTRIDPHRYDTEAFQPLLIGRSPAPGATGRAAGHGDEGRPWHWPHSGTKANAIPWVSHGPGPGRVRDDGLRIDSTVRPDWVAPQA